VPARWRQLAKTVDAKVDFWFGELVVLRPWQKGEYTEPSADDTRPITAALGVRRTAQTTSENAGGTANAGLFTARIASQRIIISMRREPIDACGLKEGDRVELPELSQLCEVGMVDPDSPTDRPDIHLTMLGTNPFTTKFGDLEATEARDTAVITGTVT
jgi:hypothetical protein